MELQTRKIVHIFLFIILFLTPILILQYFVTFHMFSVLLGCQICLSIISFVWEFFIIPEYNNHLFKFNSFCTTLRCLFFHSVHTYCWLPSGTGSQVHQGDINFCWGHFCLFLVFVLFGLVRFSFTRCPPNSQVQFSNFHSCPSNF